MRVAAPREQSWKCISSLHCCESTVRNPSNDIGNGFIGPQAPQQVHLFRFELYLEEHGIERTAHLYQEPGKILVEGVISSAKQYHRNSKITQHFRCRFRNKKNAELLMKSLSNSLGKGNLLQQRLELSEGYYILEFEKTLPRTTGLLSHALSGGITFD